MGVFFPLFSCSRVRKHSNYAPLFSQPRHQQQEQQQQQQHHHQQQQQHLVDGLEEAVKKGIAKFFSLVFVFPRTEASTNYDLIRLIWALGQIEYPFLFFLTNVTNVTFLNKCNKCNITLVTLVWKQR